MDGMQMSENQALVAKNEKNLAVAERAIGEVLCDMIKNPRPYDDEACNRSHMGLTRELAGIFFGLHDFHESVTDCIQIGDPSVQFGGGK